MNLLVLPSYDDQPYFHRLQSLLGENKVYGKVDIPATSGEIAQWCKLGNIDAIICTCNETLDVILTAMPDYVPANTRKAITCTDYSGSLLRVRVDNDYVPVIILDPLEHLVRVPYGKFLAKRYLSKILAPETWPQVPAFNYKFVDIKDAAAVEARLAEADVIAVDIETPFKNEKTFVNPYRVIELIGYGAWFAKTNTIECYVFTGLEEWSLLSCRRINANGVQKLTQGGLYDNVYFMRWAMPLNRWVFDTMNMMHCQYAELPKRLEKLAAFSIRDVRYWKDDGANGPEEKIKYNARDCWATMCTMLAMINDMQPWVPDNYVTEFPLNFPGIHCEIEGFAVELDDWHAAQDELNESIETGLKEIQTMVATPNFNPNSPKQMVELLAVLGLGHFKSSDKATMLKVKAVSDFHGFVFDKIGAWKKDSKLLSTYFNDKKLWNNRIHYRLDPAATDTGRLASKASSFWCGLQIQNIPGNKVKYSFKFDAGWQGGSVDGEQAEARCVGYLSGEPKLIALVESEHDYHSWNAEAFFGIPYAEIYDEATKKTLNKPIRDLSKRTNHGANYNMTAPVMLDTMGPKAVMLARKLLKLPGTWRLVKVCQHLLDGYAKTYPGVKSDWYNWIKLTISTTNKLVSSLGWVRYFFDDPTTSKLALNAAVAHGPQNLSVGVINLGFYKTWWEQIYGVLNNRIRIKAQIHDEVLFQFREGDYEAAYLVQKFCTIPVQVTDCHGTTRTMVIPMSLSGANKDKPARRWSDLK